MKIIVMGVSGSGKSTVGKKLAASLDLPFYDADDFHPIANVEKMDAGIPLTDADRIPWLQELGNQLTKWPKAVLACSALKESYRQLLGAKNPDLKWVYLEGSKETILNRMKMRKNHFMKPEMLDSQIATLEPPAYGLKVSIEGSPEQIQERMLNHFSGPEHS